MDGWIALRFSPPPELEETVDGDDGDRDSNAMLERERKGEVRIGKRR